MPSVAFPNVERLNKPSGTKVEVDAGPKAWPELARAAMPQEAPPQPVCANVPKTLQSNSLRTREQRKLVPVKLLGLMGRQDPLSP